MFGILSNTIQLSQDGLSNIILPSSRVLMNGNQPPNTLSGSAQLQINQKDNSIASGIALVGTDNKRYTTSYNGTCLTWTEDSTARLVLKNGGNFGIGLSDPQANLHIANDLRVDGNFTVNGSVTTINSTATLTHMLEIENSGTGPAVRIKQTGNMPSMEVYDDEVLVLRIADGGNLGINNANPLDWLDVIGSINASGCLKSAWSFSRTAPALSTSSIGTMTGAYFGWNRDGNSGSTVFANQKGSLSGGWEFVSYSPTGLFNGIGFTIDATGGFQSFGNYGSITGNLSVAQNTFLNGSVTNTGILISKGPSNSASGPQKLVYFSGDSYPVTQENNWAHDNVSYNLDAYFDGNNWRTTSNSTGFQIAKMNSNLYLRPSIAQTGTNTAGGLMSWSGAGLVVGASGMVGINTSPSHMLDIGGDMNVQSALSVAGDASLSGNLSLISTLTSAAIQSTNCVINNNLSCGSTMTIGSILTTPYLNSTGGYSSISGTLSVGTFLRVNGAATITSNLSIGSQLTVNSAANLRDNVIVGATLSALGPSILTGNVTALQSGSIGGSLTVNNGMSIGSSLSVGSSISIVNDMSLGGSASLTGNLSLAGLATIAGNMYIANQATISGNLSVGSSSTIAGNLTIGTSLTVGSSTRSGVLFVTGPYASIAGNVWVGTNLSVIQNASITGTLNSIGGYGVGTIQVIDRYGSVLTGVSGNAPISGSTLTTQALIVQAYGTVGGGLVVGTDISAGRNLNVAQTLSSAQINCTGAYASVSGLLVNNVLGSLLMRGYDESGSYKYLNIDTNASLPAPFLSRPIASTQLSAIDLSSLTVGTLNSQYSVRISGYINAPLTGTYTLQTTFKDGLSLWIGPDKLVDSWTELSASTMTSANLTMYQGMWVPIIAEHAVSESPEQFQIKWQLNNAGSPTTLRHATDGTNFQLAYDMYDVPSAVLGTTYVSGKSFFGDEAILSGGLSLPNANFFSGNLSELNNDAGFLQSTPATLSGQAMYVAKFASITGTISSYAGSFSSSLYSGGSLTAGSAILSGNVDIFAAANNGQLRISPAASSGESSIAFFRNANRTTASTGDLWLIGSQVNGLTNGNFVLTTGTGSILTITSSGNIGINKPNPSANLDIVGNSNISSSLTIGGAFSMTGTGNIYTNNSIFAGGAFVIGTNVSLRPANLYPGIDNNSTCGTSSSRWSSVFSYNLDIAGNTINAGSLTIGGTNINSYTSSSTRLTVTPSNPDKPVLNPDAYNSLLIYEDGSGTTLNSGLLTGAAVYGTTTYSNQNCVQLTSIAANTSGSVYWSMNPGNAWVLNAETYVGGGNGAEQIAFFVYSSSTSGLGSGYSFAFDEYSNINNNNTSKQFSVYYNGAALSTVNGTASGGTFLIPLATWNSIKIIFFRNNLRMYLNNVLVMNYKDTNKIISGDNTYYCGFYGQCTTNYNYHAVRNIRLSKYTSGVWDHVNQTSGDICFVGGNVGINTTSPAYTLDINGNARVISSSFTSMYLYGSAGNRLTIDSPYAYQTGICFQSAGVDSAVLYRPASSSDQRMYLGSGGDVMTWTNSNPGKVGINNSSPSYTLDVSGSARFTQALYANIGGAPAYQLDNQGYCQAKNSAGTFESFMWPRWSDNIMYINYGSSGFNIRNNSSSSALFLNNAGQLGVNTTSPAYPLDVSGTARVTGQVIAGGVAIPKIQSGCYNVNQRACFNFPVAFNTVPVLTATFAGYASSTSAPSSASGAAYMMVFYPYNITTTGFCMEAIQLQSGSANLSDGWSGFYWIAVGT